VSRIAGISCAPQLNRALRNSRDALHFSRSDSARGLIPIDLRCSAAPKGDKRALLDAVAYNSIVILEINEK
jgi:hypothetical protein